MNQTLTQAEVDALLNAASGSSSDGSTKVDQQQDNDVDSPGSDGLEKSKMFSSGSAHQESESASDEAEVISYDLRKQDRVIRGKMPTLDIIYERFIRLYRMSLSNSLRKIITINIISTDLLKFGEFVNTLPIPSCMCIMRFESLRGVALLVFESKLSYALVDSFFGGTDRPYTKIVGKEFTRIELSILKKVMDFAIKDLEEAWEPVHKTEITFSRMEVNPQFLGVVSPSDVVVSTTFEVELENATGTISVVIPYSTLEPIKQKLTQSFQTEADRTDRESIGKLEEHLRNTEVQVLVNLGMASITLGDLVNLNVGDVIPLNQDADGELEVLVEGVPKLKCFFGSSRGNRAVRVTNFINL